MGCEKMVGGRLRNPLTPRRCSKEEDGREKESRWMSNTEIRPLRPLYRNKNKYYYVSGKFRREEDGALLRSSGRIA